MKKVALFFFVLAFGFAEAQDPPRFVLDQSVDASKLDLETWSRVIWPVMMQVMTPYQIPSEVKIIYTGNGFGSASCMEGSIFMGYYPQNRNLFYVEDPFYQGFTHEMVHVLGPCPTNMENQWYFNFGDDFLAEGYATAVKNLVYQKLSEIYPQQFVGKIPDSAIYEQAVNNNIPLQVGGGKFFIL